MRTDEQLDRDMQRAERMEQRELRKLRDEVEDAAQRKRDVAAKIQATIDTTRNVLEVGSELAAAMGMERPAVALKAAAIGMGTLGELQKRGMLFKLPPTAEDEAKAHGEIHRKALDEDTAEEARRYGVTIHKLDDVKILPPAELRKLPSDGRALAQRLRSPSSHVGAHAQHLRQEAAKWNDHHRRVHALLMQRDPTFVTAFAPVADPASIERRAAAVAAHDRAALWRQLGIKTD